MRACMASGALTGLMPLSTDWPSAAVSGEKVIRTAFLALSKKLCAEKGVFNIRLNTYAENEKMRHIIEKNGFTRRGTVDFRGGEKIAYDKTI